MNESNEFRVWIGCLACYNDGNLVGYWYDAIEAEDVTTKDLHAANFITTDERGYVLGQEVYGPHEELWVMDLDSAPKGCHREMSPLEATRIADVIADLERLDLDVDAYAEWVDHEGRDFVEDFIPNEFEEAYCGHFDSFRDYADALADELMDAEGKIRSSFLERYFDYEGFAHDLLVGGDNYEVRADDGGVYVFRNC